MTELERLARVEEKVDNVVQKLDTLIEGLDKRYAPKWVGDVVKGFVAICLITVVTIVIFDPFKRAATQTITITQQNPDGSTTTKIVPADSYTPPTVSPSTPSTPSSATTEPAATNTSGNGLLEPLRNLF